MKKNTRSLVALSVLTALYIPSGQADLASRCLVGVPHFQGVPVSDDINTLPVYIEADKAVVNQPDYARYEGSVEIRQGNRRINTQIADLHQKGQGKETQRYASATGGFHYSDHQIMVSGEHANIHLNTKNADIHQARYHFVDRQGRGEAGDVALRQDHRFLKNATFTSCLSGDNAWHIEASEMRQYVEEEYAEMWHARFKIKDIPVFYFPYLQFPTSDRRRSGLLIPNIQTSTRDGYVYSQPIYWNIRPNMDATFIPKYMTRRGLQFNGEFRYLSSLGESVLGGEYLNHDRYDKSPSKRDNRYLFHWKHRADFLKNWRFDLDYTRVSDPYYFVDFDSEYGNSTDGYANQYARIAYYQPNYYIALSAKQFQIFDPVDIGPYRAVPQIDFGFVKNNLWTYFDFSLFSQAVHFDNKSPVMPRAWRFHAEPALRLPFSNRYGSFQLETKLYATHYQQRKGRHADAEEPVRSVNRFLPQVKINFQTLLASNRTFINGYTQVLEPRIQYLYRPFRDQSNIGSKYNSHYLGFGYDSALLQQDYFSLFSDRRYSGLDRIASANQFTLGGTTRFYDQDAQERFNLSLGQIYYIRNSKIDRNPANQTRRSSSWALESNWKINDHWHWRASYQYDTMLKETSLANTALEFSPKKNHLVQLSYRYASQAYIDQNLTANRYNQDIKQLGIQVAWELNDSWAFVGHHYQDIALKKPVDQYLGLQYNSCCWAMGIGVKRHVIQNKNQQSHDPIYNHSIGVTFELRGFGNDHRSGIDEMLQKGKLPYIQAFSLY